VTAATDQFLLACKDLRTAVQLKDHAGLAAQIEHAARWRRRLQG
jgi:hypothetical protein